MHLRSELEQPCTLAEMQAIIDRFANDCDDYPSPQVRLRTGVAKIVIEEYLPLFRLAQILPGFNLNSAVESQKSLESLIWCGFPAIYPRCGAVGCF